MSGQKVGWSFEWGYAKDYGMDSTVRRRIEKRGRVGGVRPDSRRKAK